MDHQTSPAEIREFVAVADRDLADCEQPGLSADRRHNIAYNAAQQLAKAALPAAGYRAAREAHHYGVVQSLAHTVGADPRVVRRLDTARKKRHRAEYDSAGAISDAEAAQARELATELHRQVRAWLEKEHSQLL